MEGQSDKGTSERGLGRERRVEKGGQRGQRGLLPPPLHSQDGSLSAGVYGLW